MVGALFSLRAIVLLTIDAVSWAFGLALAVVSRYDFDVTAVDWGNLGVVMGAAVLVQAFYLSLIHI